MLVHRGPAVKPRDDGVSIDRQEATPIVLGGARSANGMVSFAEALSEADSVALRAYMTRRANELLQAFPAAPR